MHKVYSVEQAADATGCTARTIRRHLAAGRLSGAYQQHTAHGLAWRIPSESLDALRRHLALDVMPGAVEPEPPQETTAPSQQLAQTDQAHPLAAAWLALRAAVEGQAATATAQARALDRAQEDALWWRCEALDASQRLAASQAEAATLRDQLTAAQAEAAHFRGIVERHQRPTAPLPLRRA